CACNMSNTLSCDPTSGYCTCKSGWQGSTCNVDVNECLDATKYNCIPNSSCNNTLGGYECLCLQGYYKNTNTSKCEDIDECIDKNTYKCPNNSTCVNTDGAYLCNCVDGYFKNDTLNICQ
uniref:EGF-like domain-containing protein n=1 Tax=Biomphalaria glabrata TaxID=6526 RepID=A0A2C9LJN4_BIOGL